MKASRAEADRRWSRRLSEIERAVKSLVALLENGADPQSKLLDKRVVAEVLREYAAERKRTS